MLTRAQLDAYNATRARFLEEHPMGYTDFFMDEDIMLVHCGGVKPVENLLVRPDGTVTVNR